MIEFRGLVKRFDGKPVLDGVDLTIPTGGVEFIIGMSGAGKSVLMKHVVGLLRADAGRVIFDGADVTDYSEAEFYEVRERCGLVFQNATLFDSMTLLENVALPIEKRMRLSTKDSLLRAEAVLEARSLGEWKHKRPSEVGAGVRKRAAIARTIALEPSTIIYDEPTTGLDPVAARRVDRMIEALKEKGLTQVVVSHDLTSIRAVADRIAMLHLGRVHIEGTRETLAASRDPVVLQFLAGAPDGPL